MILIHLPRVVVDVLSMHTKALKATENNLFAMCLLACETRLFLSPGKVQ